MVAVTTTASRPRGSGHRARHLSVVARPLAPSRPPPTTAAGAVLVGARPLPAATYRRRRLAAFAVVVGLAFAAWAALGALGGALTAPVRSTPPPGAGVTVVEVAPGDTLWSIARRLQPDGDPRPLVDRLAASNGGAALRAGDRLAVG